MCCDNVVPAKDAIPRTEDAVMTPLALPYEVPQDPIPLEHEFEYIGPSNTGMLTGRFYAFNTVVTLQSYSEEHVCREVFSEAVAHCRLYERLFSRMLPHSDITRINTAEGAAVRIHPATYQLLKAAQFFCAESCGTFDITIGAISRLWDFNQNIIPNAKQLAKSLAHVNWQTLELREHDECFFARLADKQAAIDVGGIAKGSIADELALLFIKSGMPNFIINLGGNVMAQGCKPTGEPWRIGLQDPQNKEGILGAVEITNASVVTSGVYERFFEKEGVLYHHILNPKTGFPVQTDAAGVTVVARRSLDAEGFSTTLLALGIERGLQFAKAQPAIEVAYFVDRHGAVFTAL